MAERKVKKRASRKQKNTTETLIVQLDTGESKDLNQDYEWDSQLTESQKKFIFFYVYPFKNRAYGKGAESARRAGYSEKTARIKASELLKEPCVSVEIEKFREKINDKLTKINIFDEVTDIVATAMRKRRCRVLDYYNNEKVVDENGYEYVRGAIKTKEELTDEQYDLVEGVEFVGPPLYGIMNYKLPDKKEAESTILKVHKDFCFKNEEGKDEGYNISAVYDLVKGKIETKVEIMKRNQEIADESDFRESSPEAEAQTER